MTLNLAYLTNTRLPSERANSVQTAQMCAAFAALGAQVTLYHPDRRNLPEFTNTNLWDYYGLPRSFMQRPIPCVDWFHLSGGRLWLERPIFWLQTLTFASSLLAILARSPADVYYSRDPFVLALLAVALPQARRRMVFEAHTFPTTKAARTFRRWALSRVKGTVAISRALAELYVGLGLTPQTVTTAPDGVDVSRFAPRRSRAEARAVLDLPTEKRLVVYTGGLYRGRGLEELIAAIRNLEAELVIVGGREAEAMIRLKAYAAEQGTTNVRFEGHHPPTDIPTYLAAADILAMPYSRRTVAPGGVTTDWMSPLKMFEYMAAARAILASDLPALREVLRHRENALLVEPDNAAALAEGLHCLLNDPAFADRLAAQARSDVEAYTWENRARAILEFATGERNREDAKAAKN
jgi:glycosyltransferase involved in cell wall biosynthesis